MGLWVDVNNHYRLSGAIAKFDKQLMVDSVKLVNMPFAESIEVFMSGGLVKPFGESHQFSQLGFITQPFIDFADSWYPQYGQADSSHTHLAVWKSGWLSSVSFLIDRDLVKIVR